MTTGSNLIIDAEGIFDASEDTDTVTNLAKTAAAIVLERISLAAMGTAIAMESLTVAASRATVAFKAYAKVAKKAAEDEHILAEAE